MIYSPHSAKNLEQLFSELGINSVDELFHGIPEQFRENTAKRMPKGITEKEMEKAVQNKIQKNNAQVSYCGYGYYQHYIPHTVNHLASQRSFVTSYTPYQSEVAQGILQATFEYQSQMAILASMDIANASLYDAATALTEVVRMILRTDAKPNEPAIFLLSEGIHPLCREVLNTYFFDKDKNISFIDVPLNKKTGSTNWQIAKEKILEEKNKNQNISTAPLAILFQNPTFWGSLETELDQIKTLFPDAIIAYGNHDPHFFTLLPSPKSMGASIVWGEAQALGNNVNFGGPTLGYMAADKKYMRQMPGRLIGATKAKSPLFDLDSDSGSSDTLAFTITLSTREQHIRREKATSNICSNQTLNAIRASIYMAALGWHGLREVAEKCIENTDRFKNQLQEKGISLLFPQAIWVHEISYLLPETKNLSNRILDSGILPGYFYSPEILITYLGEDICSESLEKLLEIIDPKVV